MSTEIKPGDCHCRECAAHYPTPAPLDPKSVHVGDTVTVRFTETGDVVTTKAYQPDDITAAGEYVYILGWPLHRANGTFGLAVSHFEILAIEPAPKLEVKPEPGMTGTATVEGKPDTRGVWLRSLGGRLWFATYEAATSSGNLADAEEVSDFVPDEPRPLPTRDQVSEALEIRFKEARLDGWGPFSYHATNVVMGLLGGEDL